MLEALQPEKVFYYFEELCKIPHGSGNTKAVSDYCAAFANEHGLSYIQDGQNNIILIKEASKGREADPGVVLQGHLDMVTVKADDVAFDFETEPLRLRIDGDEIYAEGTSLGGDDGIAVAYALAILDSDEISHPRLEVILTVDEEIGMLGAAEIDLSMIKGKYMLNLDSEEEGILLTSCAGGLRSDLKLPVQYREETGMVYKVSIEGLKGGHSGAEIHKERANAILLAGRLLHALKEECSFSVVSMSGGEKDNAIARDFHVELVIGEAETEQFEVCIRSMEQIFKEEYAASEDSISLTFLRDGVETKEVLTPVAQEKIIFLLMNIPNGVQHMSMDIKDLVETSLNAGILRLDEEWMELTVSVRSSVKTRKYELSKRLEYLVEFLGGEYSFFGDYPEWSYKRESPLRDCMVRVYQRMFGQKPEIQAIHAGLECGLLLEKCPDLDIVSIGPNMKDIHTPQERLSISSTKRVWEYVLEILKEISGVGNS